MNGSLANDTDRTVIDPAILRAQPRVMRAQGHGISEGEVDPGVRGIAAAVKAVRDGAALLTARHREIDPRAGGYRDAVALAPKIGRTEQHEDRHLQHWSRCPARGSGRP